jgi:hypothetical protein
MSVPCPVPEKNAPNFPWFVLMLSDWPIELYEP